MACFSAAIIEVAVVSFIKKKVEKAENKENKSLSEAKIPLSTKLSWLITMLWGGVFLLAIEHIYHGEIIASFPFLTAVANGNVSEMLIEIATIGTGICVIIPLVWLGFCFVAEKFNQKANFQCA